MVGAKCFSQCLVHGTYLTTVILYLYYSCYYRPVLEVGCYMD